MCKAVPVPQYAPTIAGLDLLSERPTSWFLREAKRCWQIWGIKAAEWVLGCYTHTARQAAGEKINDDLAEQFIEVWFMVKIKHQIGKKSKAVELKTSACLCSANLVCEVKIKYWYVLVLKVAVDV